MMNAQRENDVSGQLSLDFCDLFLPPSSQDLPSRTYHCQEQVRHVNPSPG